LNKGVASLISVIPLIYLFFEIREEGYKEVIYAHNCTLGYDGLKGGGIRNVSRATLFKETTTKPI
jgi:hypothetical protein